eukprot:TRINITY_DN2448_c0_g5_i1.p1 TRINITY_DN2448_c0_g5~~TRINITY_DN2448_c0_g5_i1.p1  ORF type:complete len:211 (+),score=63.77 TRINITY_DN2448_c0_g5_i1:97-729(+)
MAFALRSLAVRAARSAGRVHVQSPVLRTQVVSAFRPQVPALAGARSYITVAKYDRDEVVAKLDDFHAAVLSANWADYLYLVYNVPFWEAELEKLTTIVQPYLHEPAVGGKFSEVQEMMDVLYQCEDVRDHVNELAELATRASGFMGTGFAAEEKVENMDEHAKLASEAYNKILDKHPNFKPKIEQTVGHGLAVLRQKHKFKFGSMHRYFF